jgi:hypothetical protein
MTWTNPSIVQATQRHQGEARGSTSPGRAPARSASRRAALQEMQRQAPKTSARQSGQKYRRQSAQRASPSVTSRWFLHRMAPALLGRGPS